MIKDSTPSLHRIKMLRNATPQEGNFHYANNNPISFKDPTGLEPEGEKYHLDAAPKCGMTVRIINAILHFVQVDGIEYTQT
jgi:hypothetical protein